MCIWGSSQDDSSVLINLTSTKLQSSLSPSSQSVSWNQEMSWSLAVFLSHWSAHSNTSLSVCFLILSHLSCAGKRKPKSAVIPAAVCLCHLPEAMMVTIQCPRILPLMAVCLSILLYLDTISCQSSTGQPNSITASLRRRSDTKCPYSDQDIISTIIASVVVTIIIVCITLGIAYILWQKEYIKLGESLSILIGLLTDLLQLSLN